MAQAIAVPRCCGERKEGGIYAECGLDGNAGKPIEHFLMDPPILLHEMTLSSLGVLLIERHGVTHILDWIGEKHYPNVQDFIEETAQFGMSRRLSSALDFSRLTHDSRVLVVHRKAFIRNTELFPRWECPNGYGHHEPSRIGQEAKDKRMCVGLYREDLVQGRPNGDRVTRELPSLTYEGNASPEGVKYGPAIFASFPISRFAVVRGGTSTQSKVAASRADIRVVEVDL